MTWLFWLRLVALFVLCWAMPQASWAMPLNRYISLFDSPIAKSNAFEQAQPLFPMTDLSEDILDSVDNGTLSGLRGHGPKLTGTFGPPSLTKEERQKLMAFYNSLQSEAAGINSSDMLGGLTPSSNPDNFAHELAQDLQRFYKEMAQLSESIENISLADSTVMPSNQPPLFSNQTPKLPQIAGVPLGSVTSQALEPDLHIASVISDALQEVRRVIMIEDPRTSLMVMMDGRSGQALVMQTPVRVRSGDQSTAQTQQNSMIAGGDVASNAMAGNSGQPVQTQKPFELVLKDLLLAPAAIATYILILLCWAAWRYVLSRYA